MNRTARASSNEGRYTIVTNNWLCDLAWQRETGQCFDEALRYSGGSDAKLDRDARKRGAPTAWCPQAAVHEVQSRDRLSLAYQFKRASAQSITNFRLKNPEPTKKLWVQTPFVALSRFLLGMLVLIVPIYGVASLVIGVRSMGWAFGRMRAISGGLSHLYRDIHQ